MTIVSHFEDQPLKRKSIIKVICRLLLDISTSMRSVKVLQLSIEIWFLNQYNKNNSNTLTHPYVRKLSSLYWNLNIIHGEFGLLDKGESLRPSVVIFGGKLEWHHVGITLDALSQNIGAGALSIKSVAIETNVVRIAPCPTQTIVIRNTNCDAISYLAALLNTASFGLARIYNTK